MTLATANFAMNVWAAMPALTGTAQRLWGPDYEEGMADTVCRAIAKAPLFKGGNLSAWLTTMMINLCRDQRAKGYGKNHKDRPRNGLRGRLVYFAHTTDIEDAEYPMVDLCDPESILIAMEDYQCFSTAKAS